jgi:glycogen phosphorylase
MLISDQAQSGTLNDRVSTSSDSTRVSDAEGFRQRVAHAIASSANPASSRIGLNAVAGAVREELLRRWAHTQAQDRTHLARIVEGDARRVHYLSMEFLMGRAMGNALAALGLSDAAQHVLAHHSTTLASVLEREGDAALGNGGLGRLAACFLDSMAELGLPAFGYGLRYQFGMFSQRIVQGQQHEVPDDWLADGNPWEVPRHELKYTVSFGGVVRRDGARRIWEPAETLCAQAFDFIVPAHHGERVATLRMWHATSAQGIDFAALTRGDHEAAGRARSRADALNWVLYPDDTTHAGRELRLRQEAFLCSASVQDMMTRHLAEGGTPLTFARRNALHLNDTHPALAPLELMRLLLDEHGLRWDDAWRVTHRACSYTNHTLMPEALETWPVSMFGALLPRHLDIAYQINGYFLRDVRERFPGDEDLVRRVSLIAEDGDKRVRMGTLSIFASNRVNGVSALHSKLMVETLFADFARMDPGKFFNVTNGVTPRRWLMQCNPRLSSLLDARLSPAWRRDLERLAGLRAQADEPALGAALHAVKAHNKRALASWLSDRHDFDVDPASLFDVQIKRIHEYKRQLLNLLHVVWRWQAIAAHPDASWTPRTVIIAGKAASAYTAAKRIVRLINDVAAVVNADPRMRGKLSLVFVPDYSVAVAERVIPAADLSQQISTAGTEASGTGNMKFALNGALTVGTWDGANIEMAQAMGEENMFVFGLRASQVEQRRAHGWHPQASIEASPALDRVLAAIESGAFSPGEPERHRPLAENLRRHDHYLLTADFDHYIAAQQRVDATYAQPAQWQSRVVRNIAGMGGFTADRAVADYVRNVWALKPD